MGRVGAAGDNAAMESFFSLLQKNVLNKKPWATREELRIALVTWIERTYHRRRRQDSRGRLTPIEFETIMTHRPLRPRDPTCHLIVQQTHSLTGRLRPSRSTLSAHNPSTPGSSSRPNAVPDDWNTCADAQGSATRT